MAFRRRGRRSRRSFGRGRRRVRSRMRKRRRVRMKALRIGYRM